jgi:glycogen phosphorylase
MHKVRSFTVLPTLPEQLAGLKMIAGNMYWSWNSEFADLFRRIDSQLWEACGHNPVRLLGTVPQARLEDMAQNEGYLCQLKRALDKMETSLKGASWFDKVYSRAKTGTIAYFSAEFGIHESVAIYSGGLGILAGDHLKSASDLGIPLVAVGLLYQNGYFRQYLNTDGWQQEHYSENDFYNMPVELMRDAEGSPVLVAVEYPSGTVYAQIWRVTIGRVYLHLLDTNIPANQAAERVITANLYGGDSEMRIRQEIMLGIGGFRALLALGIEPSVCHMNEGHAAFLALERIRQLRQTKGLNFDEAVEASRSSNVFTVHTPVKAGNDEFSPDLMDRYFGGYFPSLGVSRRQFLGLGRFNIDDDKEAFKMPVLALRLSAFRNGVSELHGDVSRQMWASLWPELPAQEVPIQSITNGVHAKTWLASDMDSLYERYLGFNWSDEVIDKSMWQTIDQMPDEELWRTHQRCKERLISFARNRLKAQLQRRGSFHTELGWAEEVLDPEALTIGFARRFASYKRGNLLLKDPKRLVKLLSDAGRPVQFIFAGKAHPRDSEGKEIIRQIIHFASLYNVRRRVLFIEDYDIDVARYLVSGVDVWLNNPRRPMEASGTSGMKAAINGVLNMSTLDGWWCEGYIPDGGWVIGAGESYADQSYQDTVESEAIYNLLENEVVPLFFARSADNLPRAWIRRMKNTVKWVAPRFNTSRMVAEYPRKFYNPAATRWQYLTSGGLEKARSLADWKRRVQEAWTDLAIEDVEVKGADSVKPNGTKQQQLEVGTDLSITARVKLGRLSPGDVAVEVYHGPVDSWGNINEGIATRMTVDESAHNNGTVAFKGSLSCPISGKYGFAVRVLPQNSDLVDPYEPGMILWETAGKE